MNYEEIEYEQLESSVEHWMLSDENDMLHTFGDDLVSAVKEVLEDE